MQMVLRPFHSEVPTLLKASVSRDMITKNVLNLINFLGETTGTWGGHGGDRRGTRIRTQYELNMLSYNILGGVNV